MSRQLLAPLRPNTAHSVRRNSFRFFSYLFVFFIPLPLFSQVTSVTNVSVTAAQSCSEGNVDVQFDAVATGSNTYTFTLSDASGGFPGILSVNADFDGNQNGQSVSLAIPANASTSNQYIVQISAQGGVPSETSSPFTITAKPTASITYAGSPFCNSLLSDQPVLLSGTNSYTGGTFSAPSGLIIDAVTGAIAPSSSNPGAYTVTYTLAAAGGCAEVEATTSLTITAEPAATINYSAPAFCESLNANQNVTLNGTGAFAGGGYTSDPAGLSINPLSGAIDPAASATGTYEVTYTIPASDGCGNVAVTTDVTITPVPEAMIGYSGSPFCKSLVTAQNVSLSGSGAYTGGTFSAPAGLIIDSNTGAITPSASTAGTYTVTYTTPVSGGCGAVQTTTSVTITEEPTASINYVSEPFCRSLMAAQNVTLSGTGAYTGGTFNAPAGLIIDSNTGAITPSTSTAGTYTVTYTTPVSGGGCGAVQTTTSVTITEEPTASIDYVSEPFCRSLVAAQNVTLSGTGAYTGGTFTAPAGLIIDPNTGAITPSTSTAGTYTVTYTTPASGGCAAVQATASVTITNVPTATITYSGTPFCRSLASAQNVTLDGTGAYTGGTFSAPAGLIIDSNTGAITPSASTAGTYTVTYTTPVSGGCGAVQTTTSVTITEEPTASINYVSEPFCRSLVAAQNVTLSGTGAYTGGTFNAPAGLIIDSNTGAITPSTSTAGTYTVTYTTPVSGGCAAVQAITSVTITNVPMATISYSGSPFCRSLVSAQNVTLGGTGAYTGGTFTAPAGLIIDPNTGAITPSTSTAGTYTVTYTTPESGGCAAVQATASVTITNVPTATISYSGTPFCRSLASAQNVTLGGTGAYTSGTFTAPAGLSLNASTGAIIPSTSTAGNYIVAYTTPASGGCAAVQATTSVTITPVPVADFSYTGNPYCVNSLNPSPTFVNGGQAGIFSATPSGLSINTATGSVNIGGSAPGTYQVTNTIAAANGCAQVTFNSPVTINIVPNASNLSASSATTNINVGAIVNVTSTTLAAGNYIVTYQVSGTNSISSTTAPMVFGSPTATTGTFTTALLTNTGASNIVTITAIAFQSSGCSTAVSAATPAFTTIFGYTAKQSGDWNNPATWTPEPPPGNYPNSTTESITIPAGQTITIPSGLSVTVDQMQIQGQLIVAASGTLIVANGAGTDLTLAPGSGLRLSVSGTVVMNDLATSTGHTAQNTSFLSGSIYRHRYTATEGVIPVATWNAASTIEFDSYTTFTTATAAGRWNQTFGNFVWNCPAQTLTFALLRNFTNASKPAIAGDLSVLSTGPSGVFELATDQAITLNIGGDLNISGTSIFYFSSYYGTGNNSAEAFIVNIGDDLNYTSTGLGANGIGGKGTDKGSVTLNILGDFYMNSPGGRLTLSTKTNNLRSTDGATFNLNGHFMLIAGEIAATDSNSGKMGDFVFQGPNGTQHDFTNSGSIVGAINYYIRPRQIVRCVGESTMVSTNNGIFELGANVANGGATLILESNAVNGAIQQGVGAGPGNIRVGNGARRTYYQNSVIIYRGTGKQYMGNGQPGTFGTATNLLTTVIDNAANVSVVTSAQTPVITVAGALEMQNGNLEFAPTLSSGLTINGATRLTNGTIQTTSTAAIIPTLTFGGDFQGTRYLQFIGSNAVVEVNGTAPTTFTRSFPIDTPLALREFIMNRANATLVMPQALTAGAAGVGGVTLTSGNLRMNASLTVVNNTSLLNGNLLFENQTVDLQGAISTTAVTGQFSSNSNSALTISSGSATTGNILRFANSGNVLGTLTLNRNAAVTPHATLLTTLLITGTFNLTDGEFLNQTGLGFASGASLIRAANAAFATGSLVPAEGPYNLVLNDGVSPSTNSLVTGVEAQGSLNNVTSNCTGAVLLSSSMSAVGAFTINAGIFTCQSNPVSVGSCLNNATLNASFSTFALSGDFVNDGTFNHNTGTVVFAGISSVLGGNNPLFYHVTINGSSTLNSPESLDLEGNFLNNGIFSSSETSQIWFRGDLAQTISGSTTTVFNNINVTNTTGVSVETAQNMAGTLSVGANGKFDADGSNNSMFTLLSTADDPAVDAQIGPLLNNADVTGNVRVQRYMGLFPRIYRYLSSPVSGATIASWIDNFAITGNFTGNRNGKVLCGYFLSATPSLFYYEPIIAQEQYEGYVPYPTAATGSLASPIIPGRGYAAFIRECAAKIIDVRGPINKGTFSFSFISNTPAPILNGEEMNPAGFNLIGNPYPSAIDWASETGWTLNENVSTIAFIRNNKNNGYITLDAESLTPQLISLGQGFWIQAIADGPTLSINENAKASEDGSFKRGGSPDQLTITLSNSIDEDKAVTKLRNESSFARDRFDGGKLRNDFFDVFTRASDGTALSVNTIPSLTCEPLQVGTRNLKPGQYHLSFETTGVFADYNISVTDSYLGVSSLAENGVLQFDVDTTKQSFATNRFTIQLVPKSSAAPVLLKYEGVSCDGIISIQLDQTKAGVKYEIRQGEKLLVTLSGNGDVIVYDVPRDFLNEQSFEFRVQSIVACGAVAESVSGVVHVNKSFEGIVAKNGKSCNGAGAVLSLNNIENNALVRWFNDEFSQTHLYVGSEFTTPPLEKTSTYFAVVESADGCQSGRIPVMAEVISVEPPIIHQSGNILSVQSSAPVEWFFDNVSLGVAAEIETSESGVYAAVIEAGGCSARSEHVMIISAVETSAMARAVYPNPAANHLTIAFPNEKVLSATATDFSGRSHDLKQSGDSSFQYGLTGVSTGAFLLKITTEKRVYIFKMMKL